MPTARLLSNGDFFTSGGAMDEIAIPRSKYAVQFNGSSQYLTVPNNSAFAFGTGAFTIEFWINAPSNNDKFILGGRSAIGTMHITTGGYGGSTIGCLRYVGSSTITTGSTLITDSSWHHCAIVRDGSNNINLYIDGISYGTGTDTTNYTTTTGTWYIGTNDVAAGSNLFTGYISNLRIIKGTALYTTNFLPPAAPLNAITNTVLLTCQSSTIIDNSTNAFVITNNGSATVQSSVLPTHTANRYLTDATLQASLFDEVSITNNKYGVQFNGSSQYLSLASNAAFQPGSGSFTIEAWIYPLNTSQGCIAFFGGTTSYWGIRFERNAGGGLQVLLTTDAASWQIGYTAGSVTNNVWSHVALVKNGTSVLLFLNGVQVGTTQTISGSVYTGGTLNQIGVCYNLNYFNGYISNFRFVKGTALYTTNFLVPAAPLNAITNTSLLTCQSSTIIDNSTNAFVITNNGTATVTQPALTYSSKRILSDGSMVVSGVYDEVTKFAPTSVEYLVVGGGGGGGWDGAGGGGGGGFLTGNIAVVSDTNYTVTIGGGGNLSSGSNSVFSSVTAIGGGRGGDKGGVGSAGGSGGGTGHTNGSAGGAGTAGQGSAGGAGGSSGGGGGGGASAAGGTGGGAGGSGGNGLSSSISGTLTYYSGGGGGGSFNSGRGTAGLGGGGVGGSVSGSGTPGAGEVNTGGGSGGVGWGGGSSSAAAGSGIVIIRYLDSFPNAAATTGSPTFTNSGGYKTYKWTSSGSITF
jgi:hypothetical protein